MDEKYYSIATNVQNEITIKKSKFICQLAPVESVEAAQDFVAQVRKQHWDATHNVWAYRVGQPMAVERYSDDGEPAGTAGLPALEVLRKKELTNCAVVVTRYYGGILLGAGGLVRAYTDSVVQGIDAGGIAEYRLYQHLRLKLSYAQLGAMLKLLESCAARVEEPLFAEDVDLSAWVLPAAMSLVEKQVSELSQGTLSVLWGQRKYFCI